MRGVAVKDFKGHVLNEYGHFDDFVVVGRHPQPISFSRQIPDRLALPSVCPPKRAPPVIPSGVVHFAAGVPGIADCSCEQLKPIVCKAFEVIPRNEVIHRGFAFHIVSEPSQENEPARLSAQPSPIGTRAAAHLCRGGLWWSVRLRRASFADVLRRAARGFAFLF